MHSTHITRIIGIGSSLGLIVPKKVLQQQNVSKGEYVVFGHYADRVFFFRVLTDQEFRALKPPVVKI